MISLLHSRRSTVSWGLECVNAHWFMSLDDTDEKLEDWRRYHYEDAPSEWNRPHTPDVLRYPGGASGPLPAFEAENCSFG